ncbi:hypothetical protein PVAP13_8NG313100 [Panicum virgatum]|uniref:Uncharacterized protein n=2 Tax=Panicum virgatum TaxID=38727 RepID=A0A8T0PDY6_PANVG|nr:hypothetical protein PVAP13_8NG313100 [Panicum virgatum]
MVLNVLSSQVLLPVIIDRVQQVGALARGQNIHRTCGLSMKTGGTTCQKLRLHQLVAVAGVYVPYRRGAVREGGHAASSLIARERSRGGPSLPVHRRTREYVIAGGRTRRSRSSSLLDRQEEPASPPARRTPARTRDRPGPYGEGRQRRPPVWTRSSFSAFSPAQRVDSGEQSGRHKQPAGRHGTSLPAFSPAQWRIYP